MWRVMMNAVRCALLALAVLTIASCTVRSGGLCDYYGPGTSYSYDRLNPDDFGGHGNGSHH